MNQQQPHKTPSSSHFSGKQVVLLVGLAVLATFVVTAWWINQYLYAATFEPIWLSESEQQVLERKIVHFSHVERLGDSLSSKNSALKRPLDPEPYSEVGASREFHLTEREVNALIARDAETAKHVAVDLADDLVSIKFVVPMNDDVPLVGGKTLKLNVGVKLSYANGKPVVAMEGISLGGVPLPSAWWGDIKHRNLVEEFGESGRFWDQFAKGVENLHIQNGQLHIRLKE